MYSNYFEVAKIAEIVARLADEGENTSKKIMKSGAANLYNLFEKIYIRLNIHNSKGLNIVFSGGVLTNEYYNQTL